MGVPALPLPVTGWASPLFSLGLGFITKVGIKNHRHLPFRAVVRIQSSYKVTKCLWYAVSTQQISAFFVIVSQLLKRQIPGLLPLRF